MVEGEMEVGRGYSLDVAQDEPVLIAGKVMGHIRASPSRWPAHAAACICQSGPHHCSASAAPGLARHIDHRPPSATQWRRLHTRPRSVAAGRRAHPVAWR